MAFQGGNDEANLLVEFYSSGQKAKESEKTFADELQILTRKVIIKKPDFCVNLDSTLKQRYASQLLQLQQCTSIAKTSAHSDATMLLYMEFYNELARVLGTRQCMRSPRPILRTYLLESVEVESEEGRGTTAI